MPPWAVTAVNELKGADAVLNAVLPLLAPLGVILGWVALRWTAKQQPVIEANSADTQDLKQTATEHDKQIASLTDAVTVPSVVALPLQNGST